MIILLVDENQVFTYIHKNPSVVIYFVLEILIKKFGFNVSNVELKDLIAEQDFNRRQLAEISDKKNLIFL